ncbi:hypothetical protein B0T19DRAFT_476971 [Cercophora scortea]|uniref:Uncharacterized protein n=1 Tax=Cercophora scortea TaxID=314031 RepID=A0AAE0M932_9PEZI|nr:hypothetical protein B0T19DRAFT_476971 [Cercophora scortea]
MSSNPAAAGNLQVIDIPGRPDPALPTVLALSLRYNHHWDRRNAELLTPLEAVLDYVRRGGTAVLCNDFPVPPSPNHIRDLFTSAGLPWVRSAFYRTTFHLNPAADLVANNESLLNTLPRTCNMNAVQLLNVAVGDAWYRPNASSGIDTFISSLTEAQTEPVENLENTLAACAKVGLGKLGYVGDVDSEPESIKIVMAMLGVHYEEAALPPAWLISMMFPNRE